MGALVDGVGAGVSELFFKYESKFKITKKKIFFWGGGGGGGWRERGTGE